MWVRQQQRLQLSRGNLKSPHLNELLEPVGDEEEALLVVVSYVSCAEPAVRAQALGRLVGGVEVAHHDLRPLDHELARLVWSQTPAVLVDDFAEGGGGKRANAARFQVVIARDSSQWRQLRHAPRLLHPNAQPFDHRLLHIGTQGRCGANDHVDGGHIILFHQRVLRQTDNDGGDQVRPLGLVLVHNPAKQLQVEPPRERDDLLASPGTVQRRYEEAVYVKEGEGGNQFMVLGTSARAIMF
mmetsp:Transcript_48168/g.145506  ORF Transcript_48168/g.145506 Transcript_48168/m.145506 type:complete len:241 (+) Transcript_48168:371-1093(+)